MNLVPLDQNLLTAYLPNGKTRNTDGSVPDEGRLIHVNPKLWSASPATAADLVALDASVSRAGGARLRLVDVYRAPSGAQTEARAKYDRWVASGKPAPGTAGFSPALMKADYVASPGESNHGWGAATDIDHGALAFPDCPRGSSKALAKFWTIAKVHGFTPIITRPSVDQSEAWHFDHLGALATIDTLAQEHGEGRGNKLIAIVGTTLLGTYRWPDGRSMERLVQARLLAGGFWCGWVDGQIGPKTFAALAEAKCKVTKTSPPSSMLNELDRLGVGASALAAL